MSKLTDDPSNPNLTRGYDDKPTQEADTYLVLSDKEIAEGFVRPLRLTYIHTTCGSSTQMHESIARTYARDPKFYGSTYCVHCQMHRPVSEFVWEDGSVVGS